MVDSICGSENLEVTRLEASGGMLTINSSNASMDPWMSSSAHLMPGELI